MYYGELLQTYDPDTERLYAEFDTYFNHPKMRKIKDVNGHSMYMAKSYCLLSNECRYIVAFTKQDRLQAGSEQGLRELPWVSLQTRTLGDKHELPSHDYQPNRSSPLNKTITRVSQTRDSSVYSCEEFPLTVTLLHKEPNLPMEYQDKGTIITALETYQTIITFGSPEVPHPQFNGLTKL